MQPTPISLFSIPEKIKWVYDGKLMPPLAVATVILKKRGSHGSDFLIVVVAGMSKKTDTP